MSDKSIKPSSIPSPDKTHVHGEVPDIKFGTPPPPPIKK